MGQKSNYRQEKHKYHLSRKIKPDFRKSVKIRPNVATNTTAYNPENMVYHTLLLCAGFSSNPSSSLAKASKLFTTSQALFTISSFSLPFGKLICLVTAHIKAGGNSILATSGHLATLPNNHTSAGISIATATTILVKTHRLRF